MEQDLNYFKECIKDAGRYLSLGALIYAVPIAIYWMVVA